MYSMEIRQEEERFQLPQFEEETKPTSKTRQICSNGCGRPANVCLCNVLPAQPILTSTQIIILHHPHERRHKLATVPILTKCLNNCQIKVGRRLRSGSFPLLDSLYNASLQNPLLPHQAIFLFPGTDSSPSIELNQWASSSSHSSKPEITNLVLIVFDGTWKHAKEMVSASLPFLSKFADQVCLSYDAGVDGESMYNSDLVLRKEPFSGCMSTIEAAARSLRVLESNGDEIEKVLISVLRAMVQFQACNLKPLKPRPKLSKKGKEAKEKSPKCQHSKPLETTPFAMDKHQDGATETLPQVVVVMVPLPAQSHLNQLLYLTRIISTRGIPVHFVSSATHNRQAKDRAHNWDPSTIPNIHFHDFQLPQFVTPPPDPHSTNKFPVYLIPIFEASVVQFRKPLGLLLQLLSSTYRRVVVVHDSLMAFAADEASFVSNAEAYCFHSISAYAMLYFKWEALGEPAYEEPGGCYIPHDLSRVSFKGAFPESVSDFLAQNQQWRKTEAGELFNTCDAIDGRFINLLAQDQLTKRFWAIGPFNSISFDQSGSNHHKCLEWLDKQDRGSVIYVSFGTQTSVSDDQIIEIAIGLERSQQRFIWVLRDADSGDIYNANYRKTRLPDGFEERVEGVGMVVRDWAPQPQILAHPSTGGFMSHCGWSSCLESLSMGVPIAAWPMHSDQPRNSVLISEVLKVGFIVREWGQLGELICSDVVEGSVRKLMKSEEGSAMRKRASELGVVVRRAVSEGGTSATQLDSFLGHISR